MKLLAFDTSSSACSVAVLDTEQLSDHQIQSIHRVLPLQQGKFILPMIQEILDHCALTMQDLNGLAYGCGPGSFTGIRIASCVVQGLGFATKLPIVPISSLAAVAQAAYEEKQWRRILVLLDARMGQVYWASYELGEDGTMQLVGSEQATTVNEVMLPPYWQAGNIAWYGVGDGWMKYEHDLTVTRRLPPCQLAVGQLPSATAVLSLARKKFAQGAWVAANEALPVYLR